MMKVLETVFKGHALTLECVHKRQFPPPQMYGATPEDIDVLWRQGALNQSQYQLLNTWKEKCGLMVMGPRCLDCPLALKQNPRPGRPQVIETEPWLPAKERMHWEDMKNGKLVSQTSQEQLGAPEPEEPEAPEVEEFEEPELEEPGQEEPEYEEPGQEEPELEEPEQFEEPESTEGTQIPHVEETSFSDSEKETPTDHVVAEDPVEVVLAPTIDEDDLIDALSKD